MASQNHNSDAGALSQKLLSVLSQNSTTVVSISGDWGVGKTYFWHNFKSEIKDKKTVYVSLFGKDNISDIREEILLQTLSSHGKTLKSIQNIVDTSIFGFNASSLLSLITKDDFKDVIVCIDDFERLSESLRLEDVFGLISELKEQKQCSVVMILNANELDEHNAEVLSKYKEKIIAYEFTYEPKPAESFGLLEEKLIAFCDYPLREYLQDKKINNIRVIGRIINALNDFKFLEDVTKTHPDVVKEVVGSIIEISAINAQLSSFEDFCSYVERNRNSFSSSKNVKTNTFQDQKTESALDSNKKYNDLLSLIDGEEYSRSYFLESDIALKLIEYCETSLIDEDFFNNFVQEKIESLRLYAISNQLRQIRDRHLYDFSYKKEAYVSELWQILQTNEDEIIVKGDAHLHYGNFIYSIEQLKELDVENEQKYHDFAIERLKVFITNNIATMVGKPFNIHDLNDILGLDDELSKHYKKCLKETNQGSIGSVEKVVELMINPIKNSDWNNEPELLSKIRTEDIKKYFLESQDFVEKVDLFLHHFGVTEPFKVYADNLVSVLNDFTESVNGDHAYKAEKILEDLIKERKINLPKVFDVIENNDE